MEGLVQAAADREIDEGLRRDMVQRVRALLAMGPDLPIELVRPLQRVEEALSDTDWAKWGAIVALLWHKFDRVISALEKMDDRLRDQDRPLSSIANDIKDLVRKLR